MSADPFATSNIVEHDANLGNSGSNNNHTDSRPLSSLSVYPVTPVRTAHSAGPSSPQQQGAGSITRMRQQSAAAGSPLHRSQSRNSDKSDAYSRVSRLMSEAKSHNKDWARPSPAFRSGTPRGCLSPTAKPPTDAIYFTEKETRTKQKHGWGLSKTPQRLGARPATDAFYDPKLPEQMTYVQKGVQSIPSTPRIPTSRASETPAVGQYTSPYISCGMGM